MASTRNNTSSNKKFHFVSFQASTEGIEKRRTRSHAVTHGIRNQRRLQQQKGLNFQLFSPKNDNKQRQATSKRKHDPAKPEISFAYKAGPLQMLAAVSPKLQTLLNRRPYEQSSEPIFSVSDELVLRNFRSVLQNGLEDKALFNAIMLTFSFSGNTANLSQVSLEYQSQALREIFERMSSSDKATTESTLGAILLLALMEAKLRRPYHVQLHMGAIKEILNECRRKGVYLSDGIKRAIFWSDLNSSVMTGSSRIVDHTTFAELQWTRDPFSPTFFVLPPGFQKHSSLLGKGFVGIIRDIIALQCIRDSALLGTEDVISMAHIDNHQASVQSRIVSNLSDQSPLLECCHLAAYLCSTMIRCKIWRTSTIPSHLSFQLLCKLQQTANDSLWDSSPDLLAWILHIGGAFSPLGSIRSGYIALLKANRDRFRELFTSWPELVEILKQFIWSEKAFLAQVKAFWEELQVEFYG